MVVANAAVHQPPPPDFDAVQPQQLTNRLGKMRPSRDVVSFLRFLNDTGAALTAPKQIPPAEKYVFDLNMLPYETDVWEP